MVLTGKYSHTNGFYNNTNSRFDGSQVTFPNWIKYALPSGESFCNINSKSKAKGYTSQQLYDLEYFELAMKTSDEGFNAIQKDKEETKKLKGLI